MIILSLKCEDKKKLYRFPSILLLDTDMFILNSKGIHPD